MAGGELIKHGFDDKITWVERYDTAGQVTIVTDLGSGVREQLPKGTFVSHIDTDEVMRIESHVINDDGEEDPTITITGRSLESVILENRVVGSNIEFPTAGPPTDYTIPAWSTQTQAHSLITRHIDPAFLEDDDDEIPHVVATTDFVTVLTTEERTIKRGTVYERVLEILAVDELGIRVQRPTALVEDTQIVIHRGVDRSSTVVMSTDAGDISSADYLDSDMQSKNAALISGRWVQTRILGPQTGYDRRWLFVDGTDIDQSQEEVPVGMTRSFIVSVMQARGREALAKHNEVAMTRIEPSHDSITSVYRKDYELGDIVQIVGGHGGVAKKRVTEYVEIEDEDGFTGYPTLSALEGETE